MAKDLRVCECCMWCGERGATPREVGTKKVKLHKECHEPYKKWLSDGVAFHDARVELEKHRAAKGPVV